ncbi:hypothetical protein [Microbispora rosea]|uniref:hypothetical protein n=1 Tax=Microbispora rosea TaxID=58117 RepID=UPI0033CE8875
MTVAGGLTLGGAGVAAAQTYAAAPKVAMYPKPYPPRPFEPYALVFLNSVSDDPFAALAGLAREGKLVGGGLRDADGKGTDGRGTNGRDADGKGDRGADGVDKVVEPVVADVAPVEQVQVAEPETVSTNNCPNGDCNNNGPMWWGNQPGWNNTGPGAWTRNDTQNDNGGAQPVIGPGSAGGNDGVLPVQNAVQSANRSPEDVAEAPAEDLSEEESEEEPEESTEDESSDEDMPMGMESGDMGGGGPAPVAAGAGPQLPFTGAPMGVAAAGAGLLAVALGCTLLSARRRRSTDAK